MTDADLIPRVRQLLRAEGRGPVAEQLGVLANRPAPDVPVVHVVGEIKRGKSSLINALLRSPGLSPVDVDVATAVPVTLTFAEPATARVFRFGSTEAEIVEPAAAQALATVDGNPGNTENVRAVAIGVPIPLLSRMTIVDTPGVGGLDSGHGRLTLQGLHSAHALVFVIEAGAQLRAAELEFLRVASARIDTVVIVLTKVDAYRGWRTILDDNLAILRQQAPRFAGCPVVAVSAALALRGLQSGDDDLAAETRGEAGFDELERVLTTSVVDRQHVLGQANVARAALTALIGVERALGDRQAAMGGPGQASRVTLEAEQARLRALNAERAEWGQTLDGGLRLITLDRTEAATRRCIEIRRKYDERLKTVATKDHDVLPGELIADLTAFASELNETTADRLMELVRSLLGAETASAAVTERIEGLTAVSLDDDLASLGMAERRITHFEKLSLINSFSSGRSLASLASGSGLGLTASTLIAPPIGIALGIGMGAVFAVQAFRNRNRQLFTTEFTMWMRDQIAQAQALINSSFQRATVDIGTEVRRAVRAALAEREQEINEALAAGRALQQADEGKRRQAQDDLEARLRRVRALKDETRARIARLAGAGL
ncbi:MAG: dynamin family protein [Acidimicrobiales bacterium]